MGPIGRADEELLQAGDRRAAATREELDSALRACQDALKVHLESHAVEVDGKADGAWRGPIIAFAGFAVQHNVPPERALAAFKKMVSALRPVQSLPLEERNHIVRHFVEAAIEAYYRP